MLPTILAGLAVAAVLGLIIGLMIRGKRRGRPVTGCSGCGGSCASCAMSGACHSAAHGKPAAAGGLKK